MHTPPSPTPAFGRLSVILFPIRAAAWCLCLAAAAVVGESAPAAGDTAAVGPGRPNVVIVLCDDLGWGDVRCYNPEGKIATPAFDRLAAGGVRFTDAHTASAVCTPSRYSLLTGRYNWRSKLQSGVLGGLSPRLIEAGRETIASFLGRQGYRTACIGKWHLGLDWVKHPDRSVNELGVESADQAGSIDFSQAFGNGPTSLGFDVFFGISASLDMMPYVYLSQNRVTNQPTTTRDFPWAHPNDTRRTRKGPAAPDFEAADVLPEFARRAGEYIRLAAADAKRGKPFFLYVPLPSPHTPILPGKDWFGRSGIGAYGDYVMQTDAALGTILDALEQSGLAKDTLVIATSDNGCSPEANYQQLATHGHNPSAHWRGTKADIYEGGHRVPFVVRWPARLPAGRTSSALVGLQDCFATMAEILGVKPVDNAAEDSISFLTAALGVPGPMRESLVHHSINGSFAIRQGDWKLALCPGSGGWSFPRPNRDSTAGMPRVQLFDLAHDPSEKNNLQGKEPQRVKELTALLERLVDEGRSTPGVRQSNTVPVSIWKAAEAAKKQESQKRKKKDS